MTSEEFIRTVCAIADKSTYGLVKKGDVEHFYQIAQMALVEFLIGSYSGYAPGRPIPPVHAEATHRVDLALAPFRQTAVFTVVNGRGDMNQHGDFLYGPFAEGASAASGHCGDSEFDKLARVPLAWAMDSEWNDLTVSEIDMPTLSKPLARMAHLRGGPKWGFQVMPSQVGAIEATYLRKPSRMVIGGTYQSGLFIPDSSAPGNIDPEWSDVEIRHIMGRVVILMGMNLDDSALKEYGIMEKEPS